MQSKGMTGFLMRWLLSIAVVFSVYNVRGHSLYHVWMTENNFQLSLKVLSTMLIILALVVIIRATVHAINLIGLLILTTIVATVFVVRLLNVLRFVLTFLPFM